MLSDLEKKPETVRTKYSKRPHKMGKLVKKVAQKPATCKGTFNTRPMSIDRHYYGFRLRQH